MTYTELMERLMAYHRAHPEQRLGQAYFNALHEIHREAADALRGTDADPFYDDTRLTTFWTFVVQGHYFD